MAKTRSVSRKEPRAFALPWGKGIVEEEAQIASRHHRPTIQLLKFTDGLAAGTREIRFCYYDYHGRFQRSPLILDESEIPALREALKATPRLRRFFVRLVEA